MYITNRNFIQHPTFLCQSRLLHWRCSFLSHHGRKLNIITPNSHPGLNYLLFTEIPPSSQGLYPLLPLLTTLSPTPPPPSPPPPFSRHLFRRVSPDRSFTALSELHHSFTYLFPMLFIPLNIFIPLLLSVRAYSPFG